MKDSISVTTQYKDTLFRMLFKKKQSLLELYNAINNTNYHNPDDLEVVTLENAIYMSIKNDVSCLLDMRIQLYEQQSTVNPNMPLRDLMYVCDQYEKYIIKKDIYSHRLIKLPTPKFVVFYNGTEKQPERREYPLNKAVQLAVDDCIANGILKDFLLKNKAEVIKMSIYEYDEELHKQTLHDEGYEDGFNDGFNNGFNDGENAKLIKLICRKLIKNKTPEIIADELDEDLSTVRHICETARPFAPEYDVKKIMEQL